MIIPTIHGIEMIMISLVYVSEWTSISYYPQISGRLITPACTAHQDYKHEIVYSVHTCVTKQKQQQTNKPQHFESLIGS